MGVRIHPAATDFSLEIEEHCARSANDVRQQLGPHLNNPEISAELAQCLPLLQRLSLGFLDELGPSGDDMERGWGPMGTDSLSMALGRFRGLVGVQIDQLAAQYGLDVSPERAGWFFERFDG